MSRKVGWIGIVLAVVWAASARAQVFEVDGGNSQAAEFDSKVASGGTLGGGEAVRVVVSHIQEKNTVAVYGFGAPQPGFGHGGYFDGGATGVSGIAQLSGSGVRTGVYGDARGGDAANYGVFAEAIAPDAAGKIAYGLWAEGLCGSDGSGSACTKRAVYASGDIEYTGSLVHPAPLGFQESLAPLDEALPKLLELDVVSFEYAEREELAPMHLPRGPQVGFVAQQVAEVLPELVAESVHSVPRDPRDESVEAEPIRYLSLKPLELIPYLVRAIQEQQAQIEALEAELRPLRTRLAQAGPGIG